MIHTAFCMFVRSLFVGTLSFSLNVSACSGLAIAAALIAPLANAAEFNDTSFMSPAPFELSCLRAPSSPAISRTDGKSNGCQDATACIQSTVRDEHQRSILVTKAEQDSLIPVPIIDLSVSSLSSSAPLYVAARDGPLFEEALALTHELRKQE
tara:strand:+ start:215 stop:673 length:459 start_codon:yes stop_codon:yes gene_type:complete